MKGRYVDWCRDRASSSGEAINGPNPSKPVSDRRVDHQCLSQAHQNPYSVPQAESFLAQGTSTSRMALQDKATDHPRKSDPQASPGQSRIEPSNGATEAQSLLATGVAAGNPAVDAATASKAECSAKLPIAPFPQMMPWPDYNPALGAPLSIFNASLPFPCATAAGTGLNIQGNTIFTVPAIDTNGERIEVRWNPALRLWMPTKPPVKASRATVTATAASVASSFNSAVISNHLAGTSQPLQLVAVNSEAAISASFQGDSSCESPAIPSTIAGPDAVPHDGYGRAGSRQVRSNLVPKTNAPPAAASVDQSQASSSSRPTRVPGVRKPRKSRAKPKPVLPASEAWWAQARTAEEEDACLKLEYYRHLSVTKGDKSANKRMKLSAMQETPPSEGSDSSKKITDVRKQASAAYQFLVDNNNSSSVAQESCSLTSSLATRGNHNPATALSALAAMATAGNVQGATATSNRSVNGDDPSTLTHMNHRVLGAKSVPPARSLRPLLPMGYDSGAALKSSKPAALSSSAAAMLAAAAAMADLSPSSPNTVNPGKFDASSAYSGADNQAQGLSGTNTAPVVGQCTDPLNFNVDAISGIPNESSGQAGDGAWAMNELGALRAMWTAGALRQQEWDSAADNTNRAANAVTVNFAPGTSPDGSLNGRNISGVNVEPQPCDGAVAEQMISNIGDLCKDGQLASMAISVQAASGGTYADADIGSNGCAAGSAPKTNCAVEAMRNVEKILE